MSGLDMGNRQIRKGAADSVKRWVVESGARAGRSRRDCRTHVACRFDALVVADGTDILGVIELKDVVKQGIREKFAEMRQMGIRTVMITGDNL